MQGDFSAVVLDMRRLYHYCTAVLVAKTSCFVDVSSSAKSKLT